jgi:DnaJ-class molecular chaperone
MSDPYATLGLAFGATPEECKAAFRALAKTCHPDLHPNDPKAESRFKEINAAYDAITNPQPEAQQPQGNPWHFNFNFNSGQSPFDDLFAQMRGAQNVTIHEVRISLEEAFRGKEITVQIAQGREMKVRIPQGVEDGMRLVVQAQPPTRAGDLHILIRVLPHARLGRMGPHLSIVVPVTAFDVLLGNEIEVIGIDGHTIRVAIPSGFDSTRKLRLAGQGMADAANMRGDLLVELFIQYPVVPPKHIDVLRSIAAETTTWT